MIGTPPRVSLTALGCKVNHAEMADLAGRLAAGGFDIVPDGAAAEVHVLNSCTVTLQADATTRQRLARLRRSDPGSHIVLTGCSVDANPERYLHGAVPGVDAVFTNADKPRIAEHLLTLLRQRGDDAQPVAPTSAGRARAFLKVQDGCDHRCTYCIVWRARGAARSIPVHGVLHQAHAALAAGHRELVLTGVDLGSYGHDTGSSLAGLLRTLLDEIGASARLRLSSVNANDVSAQLVEVSAHPRLCPHWHMPLQSGSDTVLRAMHRGYRTAQYRRIVAALRAGRPETTFTTDVMVAFPSETEDDHRQSLAFVEEVGFSACHVFRYSPRPDTPAASRHDRVDDATAQRRSCEMRRCATRCAAAVCDAAVGRVCEVVWDSIEGNQAHGLTDTYLEVIATAGASTLPGALQRVRLDAVAGPVLLGTPLPAVSSPPHE